VLSENSQKTENSLTFGSVCSGIGAPEVAWHTLGWKSAFMSEIDKFPRAVLEQRFPGVPLHGDFTTIGEDDYDKIDLLVGGTPCQSFSIAGLRGGMDDDRGNLSLEFCRLAGRLKPRWIVWENVPGVLSSNGGRAFGSILGALAEVGYGFAYRVLDAQYVRVQSHARAVPQRRSRVFVVGYLGDWRRAAAVLFERESLRGHPPPRRETGKGIAPTISVRPTGGGGLSTDFDLDGGCSAVDPASRCLNAGAMGRRDGETETFVAHVLRGEGFDASETWAVRRLTPTECSRLQGFPDDHAKIPWRGKTPENCPDGPQYKAYGNSMAVNVMSWIGQRIALVDALPDEELNTLNPRKWT